MGLSWPCQSKWRKVLCNLCIYGNIFLNSVISWGPDGKLWRDGCSLQASSWLHLLYVFTHSLTHSLSLSLFLTSQQPAAGVAYTHPTTVASYTVHQAPVAAHTVAAAYAPTAATVAVARPAPVAVAAATAAAYGGYQPTHAASDYGYPQRQPEVPPPPPPVTSQNYQVYDKFLSFRAPTQITNNLLPLIIHCKLKVFDFGS